MKQMGGELSRSLSFSRKMNIGLSKDGNQGKPILPLTRSGFGNAKEKLKVCY